MRIGIVGAGWAASEHCTTLARLDGVTIAAVADPDVTRARDLAVRYGANHYVTVGELIAAGSLDAVVVATPPGAHREATVEAIEAGVAVFLEKPISRSLEDALAIVEAAASNEAVCAIGYQWRAVAAVDPLADALAEEGVRHLMSEGIGMTQARSWFRDTTLSGRLVAERGSHHIDLQRRIGGEIVAVQAAGSSLGFAELSPPVGEGALVETGVSLTLHFESGALGAVHVLWVPETYPSRHRLTAFSSTSMYELDLDPAFSLRRGSDDVFHPDPAAETPFAAGLIRFIDAVRQQNPGGVVCSPLEAARTLAVVIACEQALATGETVHLESISGVPA